MAIRGIPFMGVGRNLAYKRSLFFTRKGFGIHSHLASGDDDLFVNSNASGETIAMEYRKESHTRSVPAPGIIEFYKQKTRHLTTATHYKPRDKIALIAEPVSRVLFYAAFLTLVINLFMWPVVLGLFLTRAIIQITVFTLNQRRLNEPGLLPWFPVFDIASPFINALFFAGSLREGTGRNPWK
jgi:hypothetical protein